MENENEQKEERKEEVKPTFIIPQCCRENWDSCKHVARKANERIKRNIAL